MYFKLHYYSINNNDRVSHFLNLKLVNLLFNIIYIKITNFFEPDTGTSIKCGLFS